MKTTEEQILSQHLESVCRFFEDRKAEIIGNVCTGDEYEKVMKPAFAALKEVRKFNS